MIECCKLLFDLALYYTLSAYYLSLIAHAAPSLPGYILLAAAALADALLRRKSGTPRKALRIAALALPLLLLLQWPGLWPFLQMLLAWAYLSWAVLSERIYTDYQEFRYHFGFGLKLLLLLLPGLLSRQAGEALRTAVPYLTLMLACGVCMLRMLRERCAGGVRHGVYVALFLLLAVGLTVGRVPQMLVKGLGVIYELIVVPLLFLLAAAIGAIGYVFYLLLHWLRSAISGETQPQQTPSLNIGEQMGLEETMEYYSAQPQWLRILFLILAGLAVALVIFLIFRRLIGRRRKSLPLSPELKRETLPAVQPRKRPPGLIRPRDPRLAVRYYYAKFLHEYRRCSGIGTEGCTSQELSQLAAHLFPEADPAALAALYRPARYCLRSPATQEEAAQAAEIWRELKKSRDPGAL